MKIKPEWPVRLVGLFSLLLVTFFSRGQNPSTIHDSGNGHQPLSRWQQWALLSEEAFFQAYLFSEDSLSRSYVPSVPPLRAEEGAVRLTSAYGWRDHPLRGGRKFHQGIDLAACQGQRVYATARGVVQQTGFDQQLGYYVRINHAGVFETLYGHLCWVAVQKGEWIEPGACIGLVGRTGEATGNHLHYAIKRLGGWVDPENYLFLRFSLL